MEAEGLMVGSELDDSPGAPTTPDDEISENPVGKEQEEEGNSKDVIPVIPQVEPRTRPAHNYFTDAENKDLVEWWRVNRFLYDKSHPDHACKEMKIFAITEKGKNMNPPVPYAKIETWMRTCRTKFTKLSATTSGKARENMTSKEKWYLDSFQFLKKNVKRTTRRPSPVLPASTSSAPAASTSCQGTHEVDDGEVDDPWMGDKEGAAPRRRRVETSSLLRKEVEQAQSDLQELSALRKEVEQAQSKLQELSAQISTHASRPRQHGIVETMTGLGMMIADLPQEALDQILTRTMATIMEVRAQIRRGQPSPTKRHPTRLPRAASRPCHQEDHHYGQHSQPISHNPSGNSSAPPD